MSSVSKLSRAQLGLSTPALTSPRSASPILSSQPYVLPAPLDLRVSAVLLQCLEHLSLVSTLLSDPSSRRSKQSAASSSSSSSQAAHSTLDLYSLLQQHHSLSSLFASLHSQRASLSGLSNKHKLLSLQQSLTLLSVHLRQSVSVMSAQLQLTVDDREQERKNRADLEFVTAIIRRGREEISSAQWSSDSSGCFAAMWAEVEAEELKAQRIRERREQVERNAASITTLQAQLSEEEEAFQQQLQQATAAASACREQLLHYRTLTHHTVRYEQQQAAAKAEARMRERRRRLSELQAAIDDVSRQRRQSERVSRWNSTYLQFMKGGVDKDLESWQERLDSETAAERERYAELMAKRAEEVAVLLQLQTQWQEDERQRREELRERGAMAAAEQERLQSEQRRELAARRIQFEWRVYWRRRKVQLKRLQKAYQKAAKANSPA